MHFDLQRQPETVKGFILTHIKRVKFNVTTTDNRPERRTCRQGVSQNPVAQHQQTNNPFKTGMKCGGSMQIRKLKKLTLAALLFAAGVFSAHADDGSWVLNAPGSWSNAQNWAENIIADGAGSTAWFTNSPVGAIAIDMDATPRTLGALEIGDPNSVAAFTLGSSDGQTLTLDGAGAAARIRQRAGSVGDKVTFPLVFNSNVDLINESTTVFTISSETTGTGDLVIEANGDGGITVNTPLNTFYAGINHAGKIINKGTGNGTVLFGAPGTSGEIGTNVTGVVQDSPTSKLVIGHFGWYNGGATIKAGSLEGQRIQEIGRAHV